MSTQVAACGGLMLIVVRLGMYFDTAARPEAQQALLSALRPGGEARVAARLQSLNACFLKAFDWLFEARNPIWDWVIWSVLHAFAGVLMIVTPWWHLADPRSAAKLLLTGVGGAVIMLPFLVGLLVLVPKLASCVHPGHRWQAPPADVRALVLAVMFALGIVCGALYGPAGWPDPLGVATSAMLLGLLLAMAALPRSFMRTSPWRAMAASLLAVTVIAMLAGSHRSGMLGFLLASTSSVGVLALNLFADVLSLVETRWVLGFAGRGRLWRLPVATVVDLVASAGIFLALPVNLGLGQHMVKAALFRGEYPWMGILFWSTFFTSALFYLFLVSCAGLAAWRGLARLWPTLGKVLKTDEKPFTSLGWIMAGVIGILFVVTKTLAWVF